MLANILKQLGIDQTLWIQLAIFIGVYAFLRFVFFGPFLRVIELRERESSGAESEAEELNKKAAVSEADYQTKIQAARKQAKDAAEKILTEAKKDASQKVGHARSEAKAKIEAGRNEIERTNLGSNEALGAEADKVAGLFVEKILSAKVGM